MLAKARRIEGAGPAGAGALQVGGALGGAGDGQGSGKDRFVSHGETPCGECRARLTPLCEIWGRDAPEILIFCCQPDPSNFFEAPGVEAEKESIPGGLRQYAAGRVGVQRERAT
jgi:hypothetical protein